MVRLKVIGRRKLKGQIVEWTQGLGWFVVDNAFWLWCIAVSILITCFAFNYWNELFVTGKTGVSGTVRDIGIVWGGLVGIGLAVSRSKTAEHQAKVSESRLLNERYQNSVELLNNENAHIRIGAIHSLRNIAYEDCDVFASVVRAVLRSMKEHNERESMLEHKSIENAILRQAIRDVDFVRMASRSDTTLYDRAVEDRAQRRKKNMFNLY